MTEHKFTDEEIIKALECCTNKDRKYCTNCPLKNEFVCVNQLASEALDLINRQKAEIERLQKKQDLFANIGKMYSEIKAEAVKEFAERLIQSLIGMPQKDLNYSNLIEHIDNLYKETVGDSNDK